MIYFYQMKLGIKKDNLIEYGYIYNKNFKLDVSVKLV